MNNMGFNSGIALASLLGGFILTTVGLNYLSLGSAIISFFGLLILLLFPVSDGNPPSVNGSF